MDNPEMWFSNSLNFLQINNFSGVYSQVKRKQERNRKKPEGARWKVEIVFCQQAT